ncbi:anti-sigma F factor antagonist [Fodinisporobacter ferrooxydans]|uniref:Anti-sigma F factor antagonist n=2 Tax=Fodinisporobacter ferrooxydans TaxID=2901836 RepID=A0ABY4CYE3_9BACL|nr:anti-sigma F factor antagonist [Alicyclobacillaceae bacterium MYW30-H2]
MSGELDHHTAELVRNRVDQELGGRECQHMILNLSGLTFMDSSGLGVILGRYKRVTQGGGRMAITNVDPQIRRLFEMAGLLKIIQFYDTEDLALQAVGGAI